VVPASARVLRIAGLRFIPLREKSLIAETWLAWRKESGTAQLRSFVAIAKRVV